MRPLTQQELAEIPKKWARLWRGGLLRLLVVPALILVLSLPFLWNDPRLAKLILSILLLIYAPGLVMAWWGERKARQELEADLQVGV